ITCHKNRRRPLPRPSSRWTALLPDWWRPEALDGNSPGRELPTIAGPQQARKVVSSAISRWPLLAECGYAFGEVGACPHAIAEHLFQGFPARSVVGDAGADLRLYCLDGGRAVRRDRTCNFDGRRQHL